MKTVQEWLRETNETDLVETYCLRYPIELFMVEDKNVSVRYLMDNQRSAVRGFIQTLREMRAAPAEDGNTWVFFGCKSLEQGKDGPTTYLCQLEDILREEQPQHYSCLLTDFSEVMGYLIADTPYTLRNIRDVLADILYEISFTGYTQEEKERERASLDEAECEDDEQDVRPIEELWAEVGYVPEPPDEAAEELKCRAQAAEREFSEFCFMREVGIIRAQMAEQSKVS